MDKLLEKMNPERRKFVKKMMHAAYIVPAITSVSMVDQKLDISTAYAASGNSG